MSFVNYARYTRKGAFRELTVLSHHMHRRHRKAPYFRIDGSFTDEPGNVLSSVERYNIFVNSAPSAGDVIVVRYIEGDRFLVSPKNLLTQALFRIALGLALVIMAFV